MTMNTFVPTNAYTTEYFTFAVGLS